MLGVVRRDGGGRKEIIDRGAVRVPHRIRTFEIGRDVQSIASYLTLARAGVDAGAAHKGGLVAVAEVVWVRRVAATRQNGAVDDDDRVLNYGTSYRRWACRGSGNAFIEKVGIAVCWHLCTGGCGQ
jgi:hypothetical protein